MHLLRRASAAFIFFSAGRMLGYVLQVFLARLAGPAIYGTYTFSLGVVTLIAVFASLGYTNSMVRFVPESFGSGRYPEMRGFLKLAYRTTVLSGLALAVLTFVIFLALPAQFHPLAAALFALTLPLTALLEYTSQVSRSVGNMTTAVIPNTILRPLANILLVVILYEVQGALNLSLIALSIVGANGLALAGFKWVLPARTRIWEKYKPAYLQRKKWRRVSMSMLRMVGFQTILGQTDIVVIGLFISPTAAGLYGVGMKIAVLAGFVFMAVNQVYAPSISSTFARGETSQLQKELTKASTITFIPSVLIAFLLYFASSALLLVFGPQFQLARGVLDILLLGQVVNAATGPVSYVLSLTG
ncbi:MAG: hypothetical protein A2201_09260, partial [Alicyclobacillus sp. RIFOXYA1_FULL_53_8]